MKLVTFTKRDCREAIFIRKSVEEWCATVGGKTPSRPLTERRLEKFALVSPSPSPILDYSEEKRHMIIRVVLITSPYI